jgi:hypothetical protein
MKDAIAGCVGMVICTMFGIWLGSALGQSSIVGACDKGGRFTIQHRLLVPGKFDCVRNRA